MTCVDVHKMPLALSDSQLGYLVSCKRKVEAYGMSKLIICLKRCFFLVTTKIMVHHVELCISLECFRRIPYLIFLVVWDVLQQLIVMYEVVGLGDPQLSSECPGACQAEVAGYVVWRSGLSRKSRGTSLLSDHRHEWRVDPLPCCNLLHG